MKAQELEGTQEIEFKVISELRQVKGKKKLSKGKKKKKGGQQTAN
jgi:hypothetical protein